jgi:hypothetical protein
MMAVDLRRLGRLRQGYAGFFVEFCDKRFAKFRPEGCARFLDANS